MDEAIIKATREDIARRWRWYKNRPDLWKTKEPTFIGFMDEMYGEEEISND